MYGIEVLLFIHWMHQVRVGSDGSGFRVSAKAKRCTWLSAANEGDKL